MSLARKSPERMRADCLMAWSPAWWPSVSFTCLKLSRSMMNSAHCSSAVIFCKRFFMYCSTVARFKSPDTESLLARCCSSSS